VAGINRCVQALFAVLVVFSLQLRGFNNQQMRALLAQLLGLDPANYPLGRMTYDLRRLRLHGIIERIPHRHRYQLIPDGLRIALFFSRTYARLLRPNSPRSCRGTTNQIRLEHRIRPTQLRNRRLL
jgi:hypothetical protein